MAKCHRNNIGSLILDRAPSTSSSSTTSGNHFRLWSTFSRSKFRRKIFDAVSCGGSSRYRHELREEEDDKESYVTVTVTAKSTVASKDAKANTIGAALNGVAFEEKAKKSEKLCDLLNLAEVEADVETKKKEEALEVLKRVVRELQSAAAARGDEEGGDNDGGDCQRKLAAATEVRLLAKEDSEARVTLAMLGAIPPLVSMIDDSRIVEAQIASLYALLNLGIGNDA